MIVRKITGKSLKEFAHENIFAPLGMRNTIFLDDNRQIIENRVFSYEKILGGSGFGNVIRRYDIVGSGGVYSNIEDLFLWDQNFYKNKLGKGGQKIIAEMQQEDKSLRGPSSAYAFGIVNGTYKGIKRVGHGGSNASFRSHISRFPDQNLTVIVLANRSDVNATSKLYEVADIFLKDKVNPAQMSKQPSPANPILPATDSLPTKEQVSNFCGKYYCEELNTYYEIREQNNGLLLLVNDREISPLYRVSDFSLLNKEFGVFKFKKMKVK